jgi:hypothetical protein
MVLRALDDARINYESSFSAIVAEMQESEKDYTADISTARKAFQDLHLDGNAAADLSAQLAEIVGDEAASDFDARFYLQTITLARAVFFSAR